MEGKGTEALLLIVTGDAYDGAVNIEDTPDVGDRGTVVVVVDIFSMVEGQGLPPVPLVTALMDVSTLLLFFTEVEEAIDETDGGKAGEKYGSSLFVLCEGW